jgi:hypothetical protein
MPEGERQEPPKDGDQQNDQNQPANQTQAPQNPPKQPDSGPATPKPGDQGAGESGSGSGVSSLEEQLDAEKTKNLQLSKDLTKAKADQAKAEGDKDVAKERDEFKAENDKLKKLLESKFLVWCIATDKKYSWQNAEDVVRFISTDELNIDVEKEKIEGLDLALKRIAKDKPYLLVPAEGDQHQTPPASGSHPSGSKSGDRVTEQKRLGEKYKIPGFGTQATKFM